MKIERKINKKKCVNFLFSIVCGFCSGFMFILGWGKLKYGLSIEYNNAVTLMTISTVLFIMIVIDYVQTYFENRDIT